MRLHLVPFVGIHQLLLEKVPEAYQITIMRRMMLRIADMIRKKNKATAIFTGDSIGQVASQTLESLATIQHAITGLVIRPLANFDKLEIMSIAKKIGTLEISNRPFNDCCSVYVPKNPVIRPDTLTAIQMEAIMETKALLEKAVSETIVLDITPKTTITLLNGALTVSEAME